MPITRLRGDLQLKADSVTSDRVKDFTITADDIAPGTLDGGVFIDGSIPDSKLSANVTLQGNSTLKDSVDILSVNWHTRRLYDTVGSAAVEWGQGGVLFAQNGDPSIEWTNHFLYRPGQLVSIDWAGSRLYDSGENISIDYQLRQLVGGGAAIALDWGARTLRDNAQLISIHWDERQLTTNAEVPVIDWTGPNVEITTSVKIVDGSEGASKVLLSDVSGLAAWASIVTDDEDVIVDDETGEVVFA